MSILTLNNIGQSYGDFDVFLGINSTIPNDGKVGLVGPNGIGKTSLLRIIAGLDAASTGSISIASEARIGYLRQEAMAAFAGRDNTVHAEMLTVFAEVRAQEAHLHELQARMASGDTSDELLNEYSRVQEAFELRGGYDYEVRISQVLEGLGFSKSDWETPLSHLSGGQKTRALLARLLLEAPDLLILDEPTNHLDIAAVEWLENTLNSWDGAILIVSHDRYFLDKVVNHIWEMSRSGMEEYRGNYSAYLTQRQERWERRQAEFDSTIERFMKELDYVKRNIARDSTTNMAKGRLRRLIREVKVVEQGGLSALQNKTWSRVMDEVDISSTKWNVMDTEQHIKALSPPINRPHEMNMRLETKMRSGELVLRSTELTIGYPGAPLFTSEPLILHRQECAALIGPNGTGKTTFLRTIMGQIEPLTGELRPGASLKIGYFAQAHDALNPDNTVLDELLSHKQMLLGPARSYLARYLFRNDDVYKPVSMLSGGERGRLALAILALEGANFLLLDEPTNHLDIPAQEVLQTVLENFDGTILMVSHDRYLIDRLATQIWELRDQKLHIFSGSYTEFVAARQRQRDRERNAAVQERRASRQNGRVDRSQQYAERRHAQALAKVEERVHKLEAKLAQLESDLEQASLAQNLDKIQKLGTAHAETQAALESAMEEWAELAEAQPG